MLGVIFCTLFGALMVAAVGLAAVLIILLTWSFIEDIRKAVKDPAAVLSWLLIFIALLTAGYYVGEALCHYAGD